ncbi:hypothetical protein GUJ93_ZPchr0013g34148 [Zizania palustris]|uniref:Uncharacterized protein n=1 Tax=Zizania palustris TaxID=103762 RepID=A0A8J5WZ30_ZIZPA|nr:hypothetical protein GUJ93_ZPchr0013g34148 [Zizania palustris]
MGIERAVARAAITIPLRGVADKVFALQATSPPSKISPKPHNRGQLSTVYSRTARHGAVAVGHHYPARNDAAIVTVTVGLRLFSNVGKKAKDLLLKKYKNTLVEIKVGTKSNISTT